jgi:hypothetical protein
VDVPIESLADDDAIALSPVHFNGIPGIDSGKVVEGRNQQPLAALRLEEFRQQRIGAHRLSAGVERREPQRGQRLVHAFGDSMHAVADGRARIGEVTDEHPEYPLVCPGVERELTKARPEMRPAAPLSGP